MKRDWDLLRWILSEAEACGGGYPIVLTNGAQYSSSHYPLNIGERNFEEVCKQALLLRDVGLAEVRDLGRTFQGPVGVAIDRVTMAGHNFLESARDESRWQQAIKTINEKERAVEDLIRNLQAPVKTQSAFKFTIDSLHPKIVQRCRQCFESGQYDDAIFNAMKTVEEEIRSRSGAASTDLGVALVSKVMNPNQNPKLVFSSVKAEQEAAHSMYRGAIGSFKNPLSHRFLDTCDPIKTFEILGFASLLMRMLDDATVAPSNPNTV